MDLDVTYREKTPVAILLAVFLAILAYIPATIIVMIYIFIFQFFLTGSWIPYLDQIALQWFPEVLRGFVIGTLTMIMTGWCMNKLQMGFNIEIVRYATIAFWGGIFTFIIIFVGVNIGPTMNMVGAIAMVVGMAIGLWSND